MRSHLPYSPMKRAITEHLRNDAEAETSIGEEHALIADLCDRLESVADGLPELPGSQALSDLVALLRVGVAAHCEAEESRLAELVGQSDDPDGMLGDVLELMRAEHAENEAANLELAEVLEDVAGAAVAPNPDTLGFMLRHVFVLTRRHLAWEDYVLKHILPDG